MRKAKTKVHIHQVHGIYADERLKGLQEKLRLAYCNLSGMVVTLCNLKQVILVKT